MRKNYYLQVEGWFSVVISYHLWTLYLGLVIGTFPEESSFPKTVCSICGASIPYV